MGEALDVASGVVRGLLTRADVAAVYRQGRLDKAFVLAEAKVLLEAC